MNQIIFFTLVKTDGVAFNQHQYKTSSQVAATIFLSLVIFFCKKSFSFFIWASNAF